VGLILGFFLYGAAWGVISGILFYLLQARLPGEAPATRALALALVLGWSVAVLPLLKYPANPPGIGNPETIEYRQGLYLTFLGLSALGPILAFLIQGILRPRRWARLAALAVYVAYVTGIFLALPANPDPVRMPPDILWRFRLLSLAGLLLFWGVMAGTFAWLAKESRFKRSTPY
jgi:hypothetical protein